MRKPLALIIVAIWLITATASAQMPPGKWWRRPEITRTLALTSDQQTRLDAIFRTAANELIDQRADVEKLNIALRGELDQPQLNRANLQRLAQRLGEARGKLFEREVMMLVEMRSVLNDDQWQRLRAELDRPRMQEKMQRQLNRQ
jgi:heavy-metal resistance protein